MLSKKVYISAFAENAMLRGLNKRGQLAIFVIVAIVFVGGIGIYFLVKDNINLSGNDNEFQPVYDYYSQCIEEKARVAIDLAESQGGRVYIENYAPGSEYAPFSSQLNFLGFPVPYWFYVSGNGLVKEQMPSKTDIENDISRYVSERISDCNFDNFYQQRFSINFGTPKIKTSISDLSVRIDVNSNLALSKDNSSSRRNSFIITTDSKIGKFYKTATQLYNKQKNEAFLENYSVDVLRLYAPVDGVEIGCSPKVWKSNEVISDLKDALVSNIAQIKFNGNYYTLSDKKDRYFVVNSNVDESVNLLYSSSWPTKVQISGEGANGGLLTTQPVGTQQGLGILGFCYLPYHFVYDLSFPVMFQIFDGTEIFQFPVVVVVDKNLPRNGIYSEISNDTEEDLCQFNTQDINVNIYDTNLNRIDANLTYSCFDQQCPLGESKNGVYSGKVPACINGDLRANREGYGEKIQIVSSNNQSFVEMILDKQYDINLSLLVSGRDLSNSSRAIISFTKGNRGSVTAVLPDTNSVRLSEGQYDVAVYVYGNSSVTIPASTKTQCQEVPASGILGVFGSTRNDCFDITLPETKIDQALIAGGKSSTYLLESELEKGDAVVKVEALGVPDSLEKLQYNFEAFENQNVDVEFK